MEAIDHPWNEAEATQIASHIVAAYGGHINFFRLVKLLFLVEREAWTKLGQPAMGGAYFSLSDGPMISETSDAAKPENASRFPVWSAHLKTAPYASGKGSEVTLITYAGRDEISDALFDIVNGVVSRTKSWKNEQLKEHCHKLQEWKSPPGKGRLPIETRDILKAGGKSDTDIAKVQSESDLWRKLQSALA